jgi:hypothetical protein
MIFLFFDLDRLSNFQPHSVNNDFLDDTVNGKDLEDIDFEELNKIGETWAQAAGVDG